jgi:NTE family protein
MMPSERPKLGLALGGGAVRGAAHIGVLEVLEEAGVRPDMIAGTSAGALVGGLYCAGMSAEELRYQALNVKWTNVARVTRPRLGWFDISPLQRRLDDLVGGRSFADLPIPFTAIAADLLTGQMIELREGSVSEAVRASCAIPGLFTPSIVGGRWLVDGGVVNNLPVSVTRRMGADYVIAVDVFPHGVASSAPRNLVEIALLNYRNLAGLVHRERDEADLLIQPVSGSGGFLDLSRVAVHIHEGRVAAERALPTLLDALQS